MGCLDGLRNNGTKTKEEGCFIGNVASSESLSVHLISARVLERIPAVRERKNPGVLWREHVPGRGDILSHSAPFYTL